MPASLDGPNSAGGKERQKAIDFYADPAKSKRSFKFRAYKGDDVAASLEAMFGRKCAYCESDYGPVAPTDIEHYRPKGEIVCSDGKARKPGYYWLAAEWSNLLPSCIDCNRGRRHEYEDGRRPSGKGNLFPLADESKRATAPDEEATEEPLLLDPTRDDPEEHLEFILEGVIRPAPRGDGESERGRATIDVLGLSRPELVRSRRDRQIWIDDAITYFKEATTRLQQDPADPFAKSVLERAMKGLENSMDPSAPYACMARQQIQPVLEEAGVSFDK
ncbi:MAG TPA: hypothetical protein VNO20_01240 [Solirubrobacterales bacterium]|nr:hypothetical protein [Solirubrobacterales bacterium]